MPGWINTCATASVMLVVWGGFARSQDGARDTTFSAPRYVQIPLDESARDVRALRRGDMPAKAHESISRRSLSADAPSSDKRFLAAIDLAKISPDKVRSAARKKSYLRAAAAPSILSRTTYSEHGFETLYPELNSTLDCHWAYDAATSSMLAAEQAKFDEAELERNHRIKVLGLPEEAAPNGAKDRKKSFASETDPEMTDLVEERQLKAGGRPCLLRTVCEEGDPICDRDFVDALAKSVTTIRLGE